MTDYLTGKTREQLEARQAELLAYCKEHLEHTGPGESPWGRETDEELDQLRRYFEPQVLSLDAIGQRHGTDQSRTFHSYLDTLERYFEPFRNEPITFIEIGVAGGASLLTWQEYFPKAFIIGIDHNPEVAKIEFPERIHVIIGNAEDTKVWKQIEGIAGKPTVVQDDGGHFSSQIMEGFSNAWAILKPGGIYSCQDLHAPYFNEEGADAKIWQWLQGKMHEMNEWGTGQCGRPVGSDIAFMHLYKSLAIIGKR